MFVWIDLDLASASPPQKPGGSMKRNSPRLALEQWAATPRWRIKLSSYSYIVPFKPSSSRSLSRSGS
jgi:hypothetical protein